MNDDIFSPRDDASLSNNLPSRFVIENSLVETV